MTDSQLKVDAFESELTTLINKYSLEPLSGTPDFILAYYLKDCLIAWQNAQQRRTAWYTKKLEQKEQRENREKEEERPSQLGDLQ